MVLQIIGLGVLSLIFAVSTGCQTVPYQGQAHDIKRKPLEEGIVGIPVNFRDEDRAKAEQKMASNCGPGLYKISEEGEAVIGQETKSNNKETERASTQRKAGSFLGMPITTGEAAGKNTETSQTTSQIKEWQIAYRCLSASASRGGKKRVQ